MFLASLKFPYFFPQTLIISIQLTNHENVNFLTAQNSEHTYSKINSFIKEQTMKCIKLFNDWKNHSYYNFNSIEMFYGLIHCFDRLHQANSLGGNSPLIQTEGI